MGKSLTDEALDALGLSDAVPSSVKQVLEREVETRVLSKFKGEVRKLQPTIYKQGQKIGTMIAQGIMGALVVDSKDIQKAAQSQKSPVWMTELVMPVVTPLVDGIKSTAMPTVKKVAIGLGAALVGAGLLGGVVIGTRMARKGPPVALP